MNFNSMAFLIFLPVVVAVYWLMPHGGRKYWLLAASYFFYGYWNPVFLLLLLFWSAYRLVFLTASAVCLNKGKALFVFRFPAPISALFGIGFCFFPL